MLHLLMVTFWSTRAVPDFFLSLWVDAHLPLAHLDYLSNS